MIQGGSRGVPENCDIVVGVPVAEEAPDRGPLQVSRCGLAVNLLDANDTVVEVEGLFDVGDEEVGVPESAGAEEWGLDLGSPGALLEGASPHFQEHTPGVDVRSFRLLPAF